MSDRFASGSPNELDRRLRSALEPPAASAQRVARRALERSGVRDQARDPILARPRPGRWAWVACALAVLVLGAVAGARLLPARPPAAATMAGRAPGALDATEPASPPRSLLTLTNRGGALRAEAPGGTATTVMLRSGSVRPPSAVSRPRAED